MGLKEEFIAFLQEYKIIGLATAFVMGAAATVLVKSLVDNVVMPIITPFIPGGAWKTATFVVGPVVIGWGAFLGDLINFLVIALAVFIIFKKIVGSAAKKQ
jgi:large conductance mechanosensitive channel